VAEMSKPEVSPGRPNVFPAVVARPGAGLRKQVHRLLHRIFELRIGLPKEVGVHARVVALLDQFGAHQFLAKNGVSSEGRRCTWVYFETDSVKLLRAKIVSPA
jgi:hypothetical protein